MSWLLQVCYAVGVLAGAVASIFWGVRYKRVTDRLLEEKEARIETVREFTSAKVLEHHNATKVMLEDAIRMRDEEIESMKQDRASLRQLVETIITQIEESKSTFDKRLSTLNQQMQRGLGEQQQKASKAEQVELSNSRVSMQVALPMNLAKLETLLRDHGKL